MSNRKNDSFLVLLVLMSLTAIKTSQAEPLEESLASVENRWANAAYKTVGRQQTKALKSLLNDVRSLHKTHPDRPEAAAWHGVVARSYMDIKGGSRNLAREALDALLSAESLDPLVFGGLVYANLGALYSRAPSSLGGFGNRTRGIGYLWKAIVVDPDGIDSNFLYAKILLDEKDYRSARDALHRANNAPTRIASPEADRVRKTEVAALLTMVEHRLQEIS